jgi:hypothetical protein
MKTKPIVLALCLLVLFIPMVSADETTESFTVYTEKKEYLVGELIDVYVRAEAIDANQSITVTDVVVYSPENSPVGEWRDISIVLTDTTTSRYVGTVVATSEGEYTVSANATGCPWILLAIWRFICRRLQNVVPEVPLGTSMASVAMIIGLVAYVALPRWRRKRQYINP